MCGTFPAEKRFGEGARPETVPVEGQCCVRSTGRGPATAIGKCVNASPRPPGRGVGRWGTMVRRRPRCVSTPAKGRTVSVNRIRECRADAGQRRRQGGRARGERTHHHAAQAGRRDVESTEAPALALINGPTRASHGGHGNGPTQCRRTDRTLQSDGPAPVRSGPGDGGRAPRAAR